MVDYKKKYEEIKGELEAVEKDLESLWFKETSLINYLSRKADECLENQISVNHTTNPVVASKAKEYNQLLQALYYVYNEIEEKLTKGD